MKKLSLILLLTVLAYTIQAQKRALTTDDALDMVGLSGAYLSPDASFVLYGKSVLDWDENKRKTTYHFVSPNGERTYQYIGKAGASAIQFSPDGKYLSFKRSVEKKQQVFY